MTKGGPDQWSDPPFVGSGEGQLPRTTRGLLDGLGQALGLEDLDRDLHPRHLLLVEEDVGIAARPQRLDVVEPGQVRWEGAAHSGIIP